MFDWIGDAIDWIGDGISSLWDNTVGVVTSEAARAIFDVMFDWLFMLVYDGIADIFNFINESTTDLFQLGWIQAFLTLFHNIGWILFITGMVVAVFDTAIAYENGHANIKDTCLNVLKGFFACSLITVVPQRLYSFCVSLQHTFANDLVGALIQNRSATLTSAGMEALEALRADVSLSSLFFIILFGYCTIKVVFANIKRGGILLCQIAVGSLYIISRDEFEKVQQLMSKMAVRYKPERKNKYIIGSILECGECGSGYRRKCNNGIYYWTCTNHDKNADNCSAKLIPEDIIKQAFISTCNKLIQHYREILLPLRRSLQELNTRRFSGNTKIIDIHKNIADIKEQRHVLSRLRKKGFMDEKKYNEKLTELESQLARQERELKKTAKADNEDDTLEQLDILIDSIEKQNNITTEFDEELFGSIVERIIVRDKSLEFILISGLSLKEDI